LGFTEFWDVEANLPLEDVVSSSFGWEQTVDSDRFQQVVEMLEASPSLRHLTYLTLSDTHNSFKVGAAIDPNDVNEGTLSVTDLMPLFYHRLEDGWAGEDFHTLALGLTRPGVNYGNKDLRNNLLADICDNRFQRDLEVIQRYKQDLTVEKVVDFFARSNFMNVMEECPHYWQYAKKLMTEDQGLMYGADVPDELPRDVIATITEKGFFHHYNLGVSPMRVEYILKEHAFISEVGIDQFESILGSMMPGLESDDIIHVVDTAVYEAHPRSKSIVPGKFRIYKISIETREDEYHIIAKVFDNAEAHEGEIVLPQYFRRWGVDVTKPDAFFSFRSSDGNFLQLLSRPYVPGWNLKAVTEYHASNGDVESANYLIEDGAALVGRLYALAPHPDTAPISNLQTYEDRVRCEFRPDVERVLGELKGQGRATEEDVSAVRRLNDNLGSIFPEAMESVLTIPTFTYLDLFGRNIVSSPPNVEDGHKMTPIDLERGRSSGAWPYSSGFSNFVLSLYAIDLKDESQDGFFNQVMWKMFKEYTLGTHSFNAEVREMKKDPLTYFMRNIVHEGDIDPEMQEYIYSMVRGASQGGFDPLELCDIAVEGIKEKSDWGNLGVGKDEVLYYMKAAKMFFASLQKKSLLYAEGVQFDVSRLNEFSSKMYEGFMSHSSYVDALQESRRGDELAVQIINGFERFKLDVQMTNLTRGLMVGRSYLGYVMDDIGDRERNLHDFVVTMSRISDSIARIQAKQSDSTYNEIWRNDIERHTDLNPFGNYIEQLGPYFGKK